jgi:(p)ppGpp synthase/HD superfamily hydrolase
LVCLLHDVIEDNTDTEIQELIDKYGLYVAQNVLGLSKIRTGKRITDEE